jgi:hypothetical protein
VVEVILHGLCDNNAYAATSRNELPSDFFNIDDQNYKANKAKAINLIAKIEKKCYDLIDYSKEYIKMVKNQ